MKRNTMKKKRVSGVLSTILTLSAFIQIPVNAFEHARTTDDMIESIGVCTHWDFSDTPYSQRYPEAKDRLDEIGVRYIRDRFTTKAVELYNDLDVKTTVTMLPNMATYLTSIQNNPAVVEAVEGLNEQDENPNSGFPETTRDSQANLYNIIKLNLATHHLPVVAPSMAYRLSNNELAPLSHYEFSNMHSYASGGLPSGVDPFIESANKALGVDVFTKPVIATECGYHTAYGRNESQPPGVPEDVHAKYVLRLLCEYFNRGIVRTHLYEFIDSFEDQRPDGNVSEARYGLLRYNLEPKPAFTAIKNFITLLEDPNPNFNQQALDINIQTVHPSVHHTLLQKSDGVFYLLLWNEVLSYQHDRSDTAYGTTLSNPPVPVTLTLGNGDLADFTIFHPTHPTNGTLGVLLESNTNTQSIDLDVPDEVIIVTIALKQPNAPLPDASPAPANFQAVPSGETVQLSWQPQASHAEYFIKRMGKVIGSTTGNSFADTDVPSGYGYQYSIEARDSVGNLSAPTFADVMLPPVLPDLIVSQVSWVPVDPAPGDNVLFSATIKNIGAHASPDLVTHGVKFQVNGQTVSWSASWNQSILPDQSVVITASNGPGNNMYWENPDSAVHTVSAIVDDVDRIYELNENNNSLETLIVNQPDLIVTNLSWSPEDPAPGDPVLFSATIKNIGNAATPNAVTNGLKFMVDGATASWSASWNQPILPGESIDISASNGPSTNGPVGNRMHWTVPNSAQHTVSAIIDDQNNIVELDETNNDIAAFLLKFPDLIVTNLSWSPEKPVHQDPVLFSATIKNIGNAPTPDVVTHGLKFMVDGATASWSASWNQSILPGESIDITASNGPSANGPAGNRMHWTLPDTDPHTVSALVDDQNNIVELDESNNDL